MLSNHDVVRHATRYALPEPAPTCDAWLLTDGTRPAPDASAGLRRARAATLLMLALPGSAYLYQGEELGLHEVADLPREALQDPTCCGPGGAEKGRDGCRVPLPWTHDGRVVRLRRGRRRTCRSRPGSARYCGRGAGRRRGLDAGAVPEGAAAPPPAADRRSWPGAETGTRRPALLRPGGWHCVTNMGQAPVELPDGQVLLSSAPLDGQRLPPDATAWVLVV